MKRDSFMLTACILGLLGFVVTGCVTSSTEQRMLTYDQVRAIVSRPYPDIAKPIAQLEEKVARFRDQLTQAVAHRMIEDDAAVAMNRELAVADYFNTRSWVAMIEGDVPGSQKALRESEHAYGLAVKILLKHAQAME